MFYSSPIIALDFILRLPFDGKGCCKENKIIDDALNRTFYFIGISSIGICLSPI